MGVSVRIRRTDTPIHQARRPTRGPERAARGPDGSGLLACHLANVDLSSPGRAILRANCGTRNTTADGRSKDRMGTMLESWSVAFLAAGGASEAQGGCARAGRAPGACRPPAEGKIQMFEHLDRGGTMPGERAP